MTRKADIANGARLGSKTHPQRVGLFVRAATGASHTVALRLQPEGLPEISRGLSESASDTPGSRPQNGLHPEGVREWFGFFARLLHPFRVRRLFGSVTRGIAALNPRLISRTPSACFVALALLRFVSLARAETVSIVIPTNAAPRVVFGAEKIAEALKAVKMNTTIVHSDPQKLSAIMSARMPEKNGGRKIYVSRLRSGWERESFKVGQRMDGNNLQVMGNDDSGVLYGCLELAKRIQAAGKLPEGLDVFDRPVMKLRGTCVAMQKTSLLPGRKVYEYPYTPELFPWFYDKKLWTEYLDFLCANRMNTLYLWNGHPFASLVRLKDYPEAVEVPDDVFTKNQEQFHWLATECDKRGIWLVQMFYNIFLPKPLAEKHGVSTQLAAPTPLASDYTRKSIAEFVKEFPNVGLMVCLGEALRETENQVNWATNTILPGMLDGMKAAGLKEQPPVVIRTHAMDPEKIMPACFTVYSNLFTETKYNGESLTTWEPRGKGQATHQAMAKLGPHLVNVHILSNLEPFRYGDTEFIRKSVLAARDRLDASGIHLYPLSYWNWPYAPDIVETKTGETPAPLLQWERDWIWFEAWARYAWNPDVNTNEDRAYWIGRLAEKFGNTNAAEKILDAYNNMGEVAPRLIRRFGITEGNRQTLSLGMTLDQLVNPNKYGAIEDLWLSQAPPGERLQEYVEKEWKHEPHVGETPDSVFGWSFPTNYMGSARQRANLALEDMFEASSLVTTNRQEFARLRNDVECIYHMNNFYDAKVIAAKFVLRYNYSHDIQDMKAADECLLVSYIDFQKLANFAEPVYHFANSMQTSQRKIPVPGGKNGVGTNYLWSHLIPLYYNEWQEFHAKLEELKKNPNDPATSYSNIKPWPSAQFRLISTNAEIYEVKRGARPFADLEYIINGIAPELNGLTGIRIFHKVAEKQHYEPVEFETSEPVQVLVGYFNDVRELWLPVPKLEFAAQADDRGGVEVLLQNAATVENCPVVEIHAYRYEAGRNKLELMGKGSFVILGLVPQSTKLEKRDANLGTK